MKLYLLFAFVFFIDISFCQTPQSFTLTKEDYIIKSNKQKTAGLILVVSGTTLAAIGISKNVGSPHFLGTLDKEETFWAWAGLTGIIADIIGIRLLINSHKNKSKADKLSLSIGTLPQLMPQLNKFIISEQPVITLKINLGR